MVPPSLNLARRLGLALALLPWALAAQAATPALDPALLRAVAPVPVGNTASTLPEGWHKGAFAEIFVRGYRDSNGDGIGDLRGLTQSLDYPKELGVRGIWLMPINPSQDRDHGYAVSDYRDIEPAYGTLADFDELLRQAHARGIGVIIDYVVNHSAASNPVFLESARSPDSPLRNWYVWKNPGPASWSIFDRNPWEATVNGSYFAQFNKTMPDFNLLEPAAVAFHKDNLRFWLNRGVDGFRFDAVPHLVEHGPDAWYDQPEDHGLMNQFRAVVDGYAHRYVVCEATGNMHKYASADVCGSAFAIWRAGDIVGAARGEVKHIRRVADYFLAWYRTLLSLRNRYPSLSRGSYDAPSVQGKAIAFRCHFNGETTLVLINYGDKPARLKLRGLKAKPWKPVFPAGGGAAWTGDAKGRHGLELPAQSVQVWIESAGGP